MRLRALAIWIFSLSLTVLAHGVSSAHKELTGRDLLAEYERLIPINHAVQQGSWPRGYPRILGTFNSREVQDAFWCGDVCPQYGSVNIIYSNVKEMDCAAIGQPLYSYAWGRQYRGCTPLISRHGSLVSRGFSWVIAYSSDEDRKRPSTEEPLLFDDSSVCGRDAEKISCGEFHQGQPASINATRS